MTMTVTPQPESIPPRVRIDVQTDDPGKPFGSLTIFRDGRPVRAQPQVGGTTVTVFDYEAPFGVPVTYTAEGSTVTSTATYTETWDSLVGWTTSVGTPSVVGGHLTRGGVTRPLVFPEAGRAVSDGLIPGGESGSIAGLYLGPLVLLSQATEGRMYFGSASAYVFGLSAPFSVIWSTESATLTTAAGTYTVQRGGPTGSEDLFGALAAGAGSQPASVEDFTIYSVTAADFAAAAVTHLDVDEAWLIHPTYPTLSRSIDPGQHQFRDDGINVDAASKASVGRAARSTRHDLEGRRRAVVITSGPRGAPEWELVLRTRYLADRDDVVLLIDDQSPLLLRSPAGWPWDLPDDWYSVGDYSETRPRAARLDAPDRVMTLPLVPVDPPIVRLGVVSTYGTDLRRFPTYRASKKAHPTYLDRMVGD